MPTYTYTISFTLSDAERRVLDAHVAEMRAFLSDPDPNHWTTEDSISALFQHGLAEYQQRHAPARTTPPAADLRKTAHRLVESGPARHAGVRIDSFAEQVSDLLTTLSTPPAADLLEAAQFAHSVFQANGLFERSEQLAVGMLQDAIRAAGAEPRQPRSITEILQQRSQEE